MTTDNPEHWDHNKCCCPGPVGPQGNQGPQGIDGPPSLTHLQI